MGEKTSPATFRRFSYLPAEYIYKRRPATEDMIILA